ncbi:protein of unknown function DUF1156 [Sphaerospermopsis reniformis]|uniref:Uncharacterized protein n=1 Tax=Sphaerospermopsis reniformis TaxID=531300 RepID=A0A480ACU7_9CYAN|nr:hypothetical protein [Sphaerospermopsis reniformis]GCL39964.1 protein of unknown function DUF1156 [Sphaerospermopsis reniformis]
MRSSETKGVAATTQFLPCFACISRSTKGYKPASNKSINQILDEYLTEQEGEFDADTRWALTWFEQNQFNEGEYGDAETLSKARNTSIQGLVNGGILAAKSGKVRLLQRQELSPDWNPDTDTRTSHWEITQHLIHTLETAGELKTAEMLAKIGEQGEIARDLAYRLYNRPVRNI